MRTCGLDEAGRGPLAGPLVAAAVILDDMFQSGNHALNDSKKLSKSKREIIYQEMERSGCEVAVETISVRLINSKGIGWANREVFRRLIKRVQADEYIVDGNLKLGQIRGKSLKVKSVVAADTTVKPVMAASIVAKVTRDSIMLGLHKRYPYYGWNTNMGYGTKYHIMSIKQHGTVKQHRDIFVTTALLSRRTKNDQM